MFLIHCQSYLKLKNRYYLILFLALCFKTQAQISVLKQADSLYVNGNYTKAINLYKSLENQEEAFDKIAKAYVALGNYDEALNNYKRSIEVNPDNALLKYEYARLLSKTKKFDEASAMFYKLIDIDYRNPNYHYELGLVLEHLKDSTAQNRFYNAFQLDSTHQKAIFRIAKFHVKKRHYETANKYIDIGLKSYSNNKELISLKAQNYYWKEDYENAVKWFEKLISLNESSEFIHEKLSFSYSRVYEYEKAIEHCKKTLKFNPKNATNLYILGQLYDRNNDLPNAEKYILQSLVIMDVPLDTEYKKLGKIYNRQKKHKEAITAYKRAVEENPGSDEAHFFLVITKDKYYKDIDTRIKLFENFKKKFPESMFNFMVEKRLSELKKEKFLKTDKN